MLARGAGMWPQLALVAADTAIEAALGLIAGDGPNAPRERADFEDVLAAAIAELRDHERDLPAGLPTRIRAGHRLRNAAIHHGSEPTPRAAQRAIVTATQLRDLAAAQSPLLAAFRASGPVRAVADLVGQERVSGPLRAAADALDRHEVAEAADQGAIAIDQALRLIRPALRPATTGFARMRLEQAGLFTEARDVLEAMDERAKLLEAWVLAMGVGLGPRELADLRDTLGSPMYTFGGTTVHRAEKVVDEATIDSAVLLVADVVFRLWVSDSFPREGEDPWP